MAIFFCYSILLIFVLNIEYLGTSVISTNQNLHSGDKSENKQLRISIPKESMYQIDITEGIKQMSA